ncbi:MULTISPECIES: FecR domain-containing protein [unclassified Pseudoalteromonas]|uniref:FecR family protein n=1 Tax=unclassified Pseudoalteromonas TaxID=194690 RepID=UPI0025B2D3FE|nr:MULTISPECIES: FecR domain-containing protein [unclassified Pseudoalteromonas]MDN3378675.1 FecR domain-containing protein [Pseudoalteromonas sp. APC 3893]MDN3387164.1 FecR domain-containing protein [Pseudoalteromonas sp. APC 4017]
MKNTKNNTPSFEQAMQWLLRLQENPSQELLQQWQQWLQEDPDNSRAFKQCLALDAKLSNLPADTVNNLLALLPIQNDKKVLKWPRRVAIAASVVVAFIGFSFYMQPNPEVYTTSVGETGSFTLSDGSEITLDSDTRLAVYYNDSQRRIELHKGQAIFDVAKQVHRPFLVVVDEITVTVLGTRFNVNRVEDDAIIAVERGKVSVYDPTLGNTLLQAQQGYYSYDDRAVELAATQFAMWQHGQIRFSHTPLNLAIDQLNRYQAKKLQLEQQQLSRLTISGTFQLNDITNTAQLLPKILPVEVVAKHNHWLIQPRK